MPNRANFIPLDLVVQAGRFGDAGLVRLDGFGIVATCPTDLSRPGVPCASGPMVLGLLQCMLPCVPNVDHVSPRAPGDPRPMELDPAAIEEEEFDAHYKSGPVMPHAVLKQKYDKLLTLALRVQNLLDDLASALERVQV
jgi:hypothetical protein